MSDDLTFNKIAGAILATALVFIGVRELAHAAYHPHVPDVPAYGADILAAAEAAAAAAASGGEVELPFPQADWVDAMNAANGEKVFAKCVACHVIEKGGSSPVGPALYGIVGQPVAQYPGFAYSQAMKDSGIVWDYETLDAYLERPARYVKGTNMVFVGLKKPEDRAAVIEYLRVNSDNPLEKPEPALSPEELEAMSAVTGGEENAIVEAEEIEGILDDHTVAEPHSGDH